MQQLCYSPSNQGLVFFSLEKGWLIDWRLTPTLAGAIVAVIVWLLDLQLPMQSVPITNDVVSSNIDQGKVYNIMW
jgi:hypothetical protein